MVDLHGLHVTEAVQFAEDQVQTAGLRGDELVRFIVGGSLTNPAGYVYNSWTNLL